MKEGWTYKKFAEVFDLQMGKTPSRNNASYWGGNNTWVSIADIQNKYIDCSKECITDKAVSESNIKVVKKGTVIMSFKLTVGRCAITAKDLYTNEAIMSFTPLLDGVIPEYIYYYLRGYKWKGTNKAVKGLTLNKSSISTNTFAYPALSEQQRIVEELDLLSSIIEKKKEQLKEYDKLAQSLFYDMFGDPVTNEKGWEVKKLGEVATYINGYAFKPSQWTDKGTPIIRIQNLNKLDTPFNYYDGIIHEKYIVNNGDVLISWSASLGVYEWNGGTALLNQHIFKVEFDKVDINKHYLIYSVKSKLSEMERDTHGATMRHIIKKDFDNTKILYPPLSLQQDFAERIEKIEQQKSLVQQSIVEMQTLFDCTMDKYFG